MEAFTRSLAPLFEGIRVRDWRRWLSGGKVRISERSAGDLDVLERILPSEFYQHMSDWITAAYKGGMVVSVEEGVRLIEEVTRR